MKDTLVAIATFLISLSEVLAQNAIDRTIEGITLGKTIKVQAARILQNRGYHVGNKVWDFREKPEEQPTTLQDTVTYMGIKWNAELFNSTSDKRVYRFCYMQENMRSEDIDPNFTQIKLNLKEKYSKFLGEENDYSATYSDEWTEVSLWKTTDTSLRLCYQAIKFEEDE